MKFTDKKGHMSVYALEYDKEIKTDSDDGADLYEKVKESETL